MDQFRRTSGDVLRRARAERGITLRAVERASRGRFKASCVGAYERGERAVSLERFCELAGLYGRSPANLLREVLASSPAPSAARPASELVVVPEGLDGERSTPSPDDPATVPSAARG